MRQVVAAAAGFAVDVPAAEVLELLELDDPASEDPEVVAAGDESVEEDSELPEPVPAFSFEGAADDDPFFFVALLSVR